MADNFLSALTPAEGSLSLRLQISKITIIINYIGCGEIIKIQRGNGNKWIVQFLFGKANSVDNRSGI
jgi:hypothetical protein